MKPAAGWLLSVLIFVQAAPALAGGSDLMRGSQAHDRVSQLTGEINWYHSLSQAEEAARAQKKMIFWVQMLGDISGAT